MFFTRKGLALASFFYCISAEPLHCFIEVELNCI